MLATDAGIGSRPRSESEEELLELLKEVQKLGRAVNCCGRYQENEATNLLWRLENGHSVKETDLPDMRSSYAQMTAMLEAQRKAKEVA